MDRYMDTTSRLGSRRDGQVDGQVDGHLPHFDREVCVLADRFDDVLALTAGDIERLWAQALERLGAPVIRSLAKAIPPEHSLDIHIGEDRLSLWLADTRLAEVSR
jgi:hypothetical protein